MDHDVFPVSVQDYIKPYKDSSGEFDGDWYGVRGDIKVN